MLSAALVELASESPRCRRQNTAFRPKLNRDKSGFFSSVVPRIGHHLAKKITLTKKPEKTRRNIISWHLNVIDLLQI